MIGLGVIAGLLGALGLSRLLAGLLYGVGFLDLRVVLAVIGVAGVAGVGAAMVPARRAVRLDPSVALTRDG
jgi:ABC-type antimicrobial peptide transport system permease subunit